MSAFSNFTNPYQNPTNVPAYLRNHFNLNKLFKADGSYVRGAEDPVTIWAIDVLHRHYSVPLDAMQLELTTDFSEGTRQSGRGYMGRSDLIILRKNLRLRRRTSGGSPGPACGLG